MEKPMVVRINLKQFLLILTLLWPLALTLGFKSCLLTGHGVLDFSFTRTSAHAENNGKTVGQPYHLLLLLLFNFSFITYGLSQKKIQIIPWEPWGLVIS